MIRIHENMARANELLAAPVEAMMRVRDNLLVERITDVAGKVIQGGLGACCFLAGGLAAAVAGPLGAVAGMGAIGGGGMIFVRIFQQNAPEIGAQQMLEQLRVAVHRADQLQILQRGALREIQNEMDRQGRNNQELAILLNRLRDNLRDIQRQGADLDQRFIALENRARALSEELRRAEMEALETFQAAHDYLPQVIRALLIVQEGALRARYEQGVFALNPEEAAALRGVSHEVLQGHFVTMGRTLRRMTERSGQYRAINNELLNFNLEVIEFLHRQGELFREQIGELDAIRVQQQENIERMQGQVDAHEARGVELQQEIGRLLEVVKGFKNNLTAYAVSAFTIGIICCAICCSLKSAIVSVIVLGVGILVASAVRGFFFQRLEQQA